MTKLPPDSIAPTYNAIINQIHNDFERVQQTKHIIDNAITIHWLIDQDNTEWGQWYYDDLIGK